MISPKFAMIMFGLLTFGSITETIQIWNNPEYLNRRWDLIPTSLAFVFLFGYLTYRFRMKHLNKNNPINKL